MKIEWKHSFEIHIPLIDAEHKYLVRLFNDFHDEFENNTWIDISSGHVEP